MSIKCLMFTEQENEEQDHKHREPVRRIFDALEYFVFYLSKVFSLLDTKKLQPQHLCIFLQ